MIHRLGWKQAGLDGLVGLDQAGCPPQQKERQAGKIGLSLGENPAGKNQLEKEINQGYHGTFSILTKAFQADPKKIASDLPGGNLRGLN